MIGVVIVAHGSLACEYLAAVEHVVGKQSGIRVISIEPDHDRSSKEKEICAASDSVDVGDGVIIVTDMFGGSPSNLSLLACSPANRRILYGANLPMLIKLARCRHQTVDKAVECAKIAGRKYLDVYNCKPNETGIDPS